MAYRKEKTTGGHTDLVIDGWEKGIAASPYTGIANMRNVNTSWYPGVAYVNYKRTAATLSGSTMTKPMFTTQSPGGIIYILDDTQQVWKQNSQGSTTFTKITGNPTTNGQGNGLIWWLNYLIVFRSTFIDICGDGTGDSGITSSNWNTGSGTSGVWPIANATLTLTGTPAAAATTATISTYTDAQGDNRAFWNGPTGTYQLTFGNGQIVSGTLTQGSAAVSWAPVGIFAGGASSATVTVTALFSGIHQAFVSSRTGNVYFTNGSFIGSIKVNAGYTFSKSNFTTFTFSYGDVKLPNADTATWLSELVGNMVIAGINRIYTWDTTSAAVTDPITVPENIIKTITVLNIVYIFAGYKGNIYQTNGYSVSLLKKIPDGMWGLIDPYLQWGGVMAHRNKLYFQVYASNNVSTGSAMGIFSLAIISGQLSTEFDTSGALVLENQNSFGYTITATATANGILSDFPTAVADTYFSAWYNNSAGGVDYNDTTLYQNFEPVIETDIIPVGQFFEKGTFESVEYKLDRPLANGDSIRLSYRTSLSDSYTLVGNSAYTGGAGVTTATASAATQVLSDTFNSNVNSAQWVQFKIELSCASSNSSRIPLREVRLHYI